MDGSFATPLSLESFSDRRRSLLDALGAHSVLEAPELRHVEAILHESREPLDQIICKLGIATEEQLASAYAEIFSLPLYQAQSSTTLDADDDVFKKEVNRQFLFNNRMLPVSITQDNAKIAVVDPSDKNAVAGMEFALERHIEIVVITASLFDRIFAANYPQEQQDIDDVGGVDAASDIDRLKDIASAEPVVRYVNRLIDEASRRRASDIHIEPMARQTHVRLRIDGQLTDFDTLAGGQALSVVSRLKILSDLDIAEQRRPQDGRTSFSVGGRSIDLRLSTNPTVTGESMVIRLLDQSRAPLDLERLGFNSETCQQLREWVSAPNGMLLLTGPTGSGKTTTLYSLLKMLATGERKILTIEDPVEYKLPGVNQSQANPAIGLTFANALRSFLRHDPDIIMVGEMRDAETARIAMRAAMTGHLVLSTLHTNDAPSAITRLIDMGVEDYLVASTLLGVVGQRLVRRLCNACGGTARERNASETCPQCHGTGFHGRSVISETLKVDTEVRAAIRTGAQRQDIAKAAAHQGFKSMQEDGDAKAAQGVMTNDDVNRAIGSYAD